MRQKCWFNTVLLLCYFGRDKFLNEIYEMNDVFQIIAAKVMKCESKVREIQWFGCLKNVLRS